MAQLRKAIAIDFDGCLCSNAYPNIGKPCWPVINRAIQEQQAGAGLILWTCREGELLDSAVKTCREWGLEFDAVNDSLPDWIAAFETNPRKIGATEYWDDKAVQMGPTGTEGIAVAAAISPMPERRGTTEAGGGKDATHGRYNEN